MIKSFLFPTTPSDNMSSIGLLLLRMLFGLMLMSHGWDKLIHFNEMAPYFVGGSMGLGLSVFAEFFCAFAFFIGLLYRLALIPLIVNMFVALALAHHFRLVGEGNGEMAFLYLSVFVSAFISGPGKFTLDHFLIRTIQRKRATPSAK